MLNLSELNYKKVFLAILILIVCFSLLFGLIWLFFLKDQQKTSKVSVSTVTPGGSLPMTDEGNNLNIVGTNGRLISEKDISSDNFRDANGNLQLAKTANGSATVVSSILDEKVSEVNTTGRGFNFLSGEDNKFYFLKDGKKVALSQNTFPFVDEVTWSNDGNKVVLSYPDGSNLYYDFTKNKKITLPTGAENFSFNSDSNEIAYKFVNNSSENNWLVVSDIKNNKTSPIEHLGDNGKTVEVSWSPNNQVVALYHESTGLDSEEVYFLGLHDENFRSLKVNGSNFKGIWSPQGDRILYHVISPTNDYNPILGIADANGDNIGNHNFMLGLTTWVDKCSFAKDNKTVYCAVPVNLPTGAGMYPELANKSKDVFYKIDLTTGISKLIAYPMLSEKLDKFQVKKLFISDDGTKLYFWDNWTKKIYMMRLR